MDPNLPPSKLQTTIRPRLKDIVEHGHNIQAQNPAPATRLRHPNHPVMTYFATTTQNHPRYLFRACWPSQISTIAPNHFPVITTTTITPPCFIRRKLPPPQTILDLHAEHIFDLLFTPFKASETFFTSWSDSLAWVLVESISLCQGLSIAVLDTTKLPAENHVHWSYTNGDEYLIFGVIDAGGGEVFKTVQFDDFGPPFAGARIVRTELGMGGPVKFRGDTRLGVEHIVYPDIQAIIRVAKLYSDAFVLPMTIFLCAMLGDCSADEEVVDTFHTELSLSEDLATDEATSNKKDRSRHPYGSSQYVRWEETDNVMALWRALIQRAEAARYAEPVEAEEEWVLV